MSAKAQAVAERKEERRQLKQELAELRQYLRDARTTWRTAVQEAREHCRVEKQRIREHARQLRLQVLEECRATIRAEKEAANAAHLARLEQVSSFEQEVHRLRGKIASALQLKRDRAAIARDDLQRRRNAPAITGIGVHVETDDEVREHLTEKLAPLFEEMKRKVQPSKKGSRTEAFLDYAHAHPEEVLAAEEHPAHVEVEQLEAHEATLVKRVSAYELKKNMRIAKLRERAEKRSQEATNALASADRIASGIPMGQPILVGHHSEKRHRRDIDRIQRGTRKGFDLRKQAEELSRRADSAEDSDAVSSDDPEAVPKLRVKLEAIEKKRALMVAANKVIRSSKSPAEGLQELGFSEAKARELLTPDFMNRLGFASYALTNAAKESGRIRGRIEELEKRATQPKPPPVEVAGGRIEEDENRVRIVFDAIPDKALRTELKRAGFKWAPSVGAWQRHASAWAWHEAKRLLQVPVGVPSYVPATPASPSTPATPAMPTPIWPEPEDEEPRATAAPVSTLTVKPAGGFALTPVYAAPAERSGRMFEFSTHRPVGRAALTDVPARSPAPANAPFSLSPVPVVRMPSTADLFAAPSRPSAALPAPSALPPRGAVKDTGKGVPAPAALSLSTKQIEASVRAEVNDALRAGRVPAAVYKVSSLETSNGSSVTIDVTHIGRTLSDAEAEELKTELLALVQRYAPSHVLRKLKGYAIVDRASGLPPPARAIKPSPTASSWPAKAKRMGPRALAKIIRRAIADEQRAKRLPKATVSVLPTNEGGLTIQVTKAVYQGDWTRQEFAKRLEAFLATYRAEPYSARALGVSLEETSARAVETPKSPASGAKLPAGAAELRAGIAKADHEYALMVAVNTMLGSLYPTVPLDPRVVGRLRALGLPEAEVRILTTMNTRGQVGYARDDIAARLNESGRLRKKLIALGVPASAVPPAPVPSVYLLAPNPPKGFDPVKAAALLRTQIAAERKAGRLPEATYSVSTPKGTTRAKIVVSGLPFAVINPRAMKIEGGSLERDASRGESILTASASEVEQAIHRLANAHHGTGFEHDVSVQPATGERGSVEAALVAANGPRRSAPMGATSKRPGERVSASSRDEGRA